MMIINHWYPQNSGANLRNEEADQIGRGGQSDRILQIFNSNKAKSDNHIHSLLNDPNVNQPFSGNKFRISDFYPSCLSLLSNFDSIL